MTWSGFLLPEGAGWMSHQLTIIIYEMTYAICRLQPNAAAPVWAAGERIFVDYQNGKRAVDRM